MAEPGGVRLRAQGLRFLAARRNVLLLLTVWSLLETGQTFLSGYAVARALDRGFLAGRQDVGLGWLALAAVAVVIGAYGTRRSFDALAVLVEDLRDGLVRGVVRQALAAAVARPHLGESAAVSRLTQQVEIARDTSAGLVMAARSFVFTAVGALYGMFSLAPVLLVVVLPPLAAGLGLFLATLYPLSRRQAAFLAADEAVAQDMGTVAAGLRDITACGAEERVASRSGRLLAAEAATSRALARWGTARSAAFGVAAEAPIALLLVAGPWLLRQGVTAGAMVGALTYLTQSLRPALQNLVHGLGAAGARFTVVLRRLTEAPATAQLPRQGQAQPQPQPDPALPAPALELRAVTFAYGDRAEPVVRELDLVVPRGSHLAVVGPSGIGKSTLTGLAAGLLAPRAGLVLVDGESVSATRMDGQSLQRVLIPQEAFVFTGTFRENLAYLLPGTGAVPDPVLMDAAAAVGADGLLRRAGGLDSAVDPAAFSAAERQLLALARCYACPAPLVLLDEATCHLDPVAEARAELAFARRPGTTLVVVAHRISSARRAQRILLMDGTRTVFGSHRELLRLSPLYRDLVGSWSRDDLRPSYPAGPSGDPYGVHPVARTGLAGDRGEIVAHRSVGQIERPRDLRNGGAVGAE